MTDYNLSEGSLQIIMDGGNVANPIMQVLGSKKINSGSAEKERYRILLSDGRHSISFAMLTTQINGGELETFSVIKIDKYITSLIKNSEKGDTRVLLILDMKILHPGNQVNKKIGSPVPISDASKEEGKSTTNGSTSTSSTISKPMESGSLSYANGTADLSAQPTHPIASLSPYHNKWIIKARVTNKSSIRTWSNAKGEGKLFNVDLVDESGEIRLTAFRDMVDKYYDYLQVDKIYYITKCTLKNANKQFSTLKNDYEMTMTNETIIQECKEADDSSIPQTKYDFVPIDKISAAEVGSLIDVVAVVKNCGDVQTLQSRTTGRELKKRDVTLVDNSNAAIDLTLWGTDAEEFDGTNNPVIVMKGARISEFGGGKNLSTISSSNIKATDDTEMLCEKKDLGTVKEVCSEAQHIKVVENQSIQNATDSDNNLIAAETHINDGIQDTVTVESVRTPPRRQKRKNDDSQSLVANTDCSVKKRRDGEFSCPCAKFLFDVSDDQTFGDFVASVLSSYSSQKMNMKLRRMIHRAIMDIQEEYDNPYAFELSNDTLQSTLVDEKEIKSEPSSFHTGDGVQELHIIKKEIKSEPSSLCTNEDIQQSTSRLAHLTTDGTAAAQN